MDAKIILDTNIPAKAAAVRGESSANISLDELKIQEKCIRFIGELTKGDTKLVLDLDYEIIKEYENNVARNTSMGTLFFRWLYRYLGQIDVQHDFLRLERDSAGGYVDFPQDEEILEFDPSDRKFIALANLHLEKPPIIEGTDVKWWGYVQAFKKYGIKIHFLDEVYAEKKYHEKMG